MCVSIYICKWICVCKKIYVHISIYLYTYKCTSIHEIHAYICIWIYVCIMYTYMIIYACMHAWVYVCMCVCVQYNYIYIIHACMWQLFHHRNKHKKTQSGHGMFPTSEHCRDDAEAAELKTGTTTARSASFLGTLQAWSNDSGILQNATLIGHWWWTIGYHRVEDVDFSC